MSDVKVAIVDAKRGKRSALVTLIDGTDGFTLAGQFGSVDEAQGKLDLEPPDVVLLGVHDGERPAGAIRALKDRYPALQVLVLSPPADDPDVFDVIRAGASGYLLRDTTPARVLEALRELRDGGAPMSPAIARSVVTAFRETAPAPAPASPRLSRRETETLRLLAAGHSYKTCAAELRLSVDTVRFHVRNIYDKLHVHSKVEAVLKAVRGGLV